MAKKFGPTVGGLFLAFPAIFPATATLIERHEREKKRQKGLTGEPRGRDAAALEATGSALGSIGLLFWRPPVDRAEHHPWLVFLAATIIWVVASIGLWFFHRIS